jgi:hypothetical protein
MENRTAIVTIVLFLVFGFAANTQTLVISDPLTDGTSKGVIDVSTADATAAFTAEGWQPGASFQNQNHILYDVPFMFKEGYLEFEVKGLSTPSSIDYDPALCALYDGRGINEPILYFNDFKQNCYRWNVHFRGDNGLFKCKIQTAANNEEKDTRDKAVFQGADYGLDAQCLNEPNGSAVVWNAAKWYKVKVDWKAKKYTVTVDGNQVWGTTLGCDFTPRDMKIWLGCAPGSSGKYTATQPGLTFKNFKLYTYDSPKLNCGYGSVNLPATSFVSFGKNIKNETIVKQFFFENLTAGEMPISITQNNSDFSIASTNFTLAPAEKKMVDITMNANAALVKRTTFTISSTALTTSYSMTCISSVLNETLSIVGTYEDLFDASNVSSYYKIENALDYALTESAGTMKINVTKNRANKFFSAIYFEPKTLTDSFYVDMTSNPYMAVKVKSNTNFLLQLGPVQFGVSGNINREPYANVGTGGGTYNVMGDNSWQWKFFDFSQRFITTSTTPSMIQKIYFNFSPGENMVGNVEFDEFIIGAHALDYAPFSGLHNTNSTVSTQFFYPNPANDIITLRDVNNTSSLSITDIAGRSIRIIQPSTANINVSNLNSGIYFVKIINKDKSFIVEKLLKN